MKAKQARNQPAAAAAAAVLLEYILYIALTGGIEAAAAAATATAAAAAPVLDAVPTPCMMRNIKAHPAKSWPSETEKRDHASLQRRASWWKWGLFLDEDVTECSSKIATMSYKIQIYTFTLNLESIVLKNNTMFKRKL